MRPLLTLAALRPRTVLAVTALATVLALGSLWDFASGEPRLRIETEVNAILREGDEASAAYARFRERFGNDEVVLLSLTADDLFTAPTLRAVERITTRLEAVPGVQSVLSLSNALDARSADGEVRIEPLLDGIPDDPVALRALCERLLGNPLQVGNLVSRSGRATAFIVRPEEMSEKEFRSRGIDDALLRAAQEEAGDAGRVELAGALPVKAAVSRLLYRDLLVVVPASFLVNAAVVFAVFRTWQGTAIPIAAVALAQLWTLALIVLSGRSLNLVTYVVPPVVLAVGLSYAVHAVAEHGEVLRERGGAAGPEAAALALERIRVPIFLMAVTTGVGFLSLVVSPLPAVREFGWFCVAGVVFAWLVAMTFVPALLSLIPPPPLRRISGGRFEALAERLAHVDLRHARSLLAAGVGIAVVAIYGVTQIRVNTSLLDNLPRSHPVRLAIESYDREFDGHAQLYVMLEGERDGFFKQPEQVRRLRGLQDWLEAQPSVRGTTSIADHLMVLNRAFHRDDPAYFAVPESAALIGQFFFFWNESLASFVDREFASATVLVRTTFPDTEGYARLIAAIERHTAEAFPDLTAHTTGNTSLIVRTVDDITLGQAISLSTATLLILLVLLAYFRSLRVALLALLPNTLPVLVYFGTLGLTGVSLNIITSLIACIVLGTAVDNTMHLLSRYRTALRENGDDRQAAVEALRHVALPGTTTSLALALGFAVFVTSGLRHQVEFGWLAASITLVALLADATLTPVLASRMGLGRRRGSAGP
jgi:predicted RND superfamily exporter protein